MINSNSWPFIEAQRILDSLGGKLPSKGYVLFETGYGPSGLPHIGTFGEVARTTMVKRAFELLSDMPTKLIAFSDDLDGLRKIPDNIPNPEMVKKHLGKPLTSVPDPFGEEESFAANMNKRLCHFLDKFGFEYDFYSSTKCYQTGMFDQMLLKALGNYQEFMDVMLPSLGEERQQTYSPFFPICPETGLVLQIPTISTDVTNGTITFRKDDGSELTSSVTGGKCKLQWKADWAMRWAALDVNYEMFGKDLIPTAELSAKLAQIMVQRQPILFNYELFLDQNGQKISKSKGNGISIDDWLKYAPTESLALYMYQSPKKAKKLYFDVIPRQVDDYLTYISKYDSEDEKRYDNPVWHIHQGNPPKHEVYGITFNLLLNLASACNPENDTVLWGFINKYAPKASSKEAPFLKQLVDFSITYYNNFIKPHKKLYQTSIQEKAILTNLKTELEKLDEQTSNSDDIQNMIYAIGNEAYGESNLKEFFKLLYQSLLGQTEGPRLGSFIKLYGIKNSITLVDKALELQ